MSKRNLIVWLMMGLCWMVLPAKASGLGDIRVHARFLTDRMAFELNLNQYQYDDLYEVNFDFLCGIDPYINDLAYSRAAAMDAYYRYLDERNDDLRWILSSAEYLRFMAIDYFFRPIYAVNHCCYLRVYQIYPNRTFFYFGRPRHYLTYRGAHSRFHCGGRSYYREHFSRRYTHAVYKGHFHSRPDFRKHDFGPGARPGVRPGGLPPAKPGGPGYHFTPVNPKPGNRPGGPEANRPGNRPDKPEVNRPSNRPGNSEPSARPNRPANRPQAGNRPESGRKPETGKRPESSRKPNNGKRPEATIARPVNNRVTRPEATKNRPANNRVVRPSSTDNRRNASRSGSYSRPSETGRSQGRGNVRQVERKNNEGNRKQTDRRFLREM